MSFIRTGFRELGLKVRRQKTRLALRHEKRLLQKSEINLGREGTSQAANFPELRNEIVARAPTAEQLGSTHPQVLSGLGRLYADSISHLRPRVLVQGNPHYLGQADIVAEIRAVLLAALRSAVLWRQLDGSLWDFLLRRRAMVAVIESETG